MLWTPSISWSDHPNILFSLQIAKLFTVQLSTASCYFFLKDGTISKVSVTYWRLPQILRSPTHRQFLIFTIYYNNKNVVYVMTELGCRHANLI